MKALIAQNVRAMKAGRGILMACLLAGSIQAQDRSADPGLTAHEWGTFTSVAGSDGYSVEWSPLTGSTNLPGFVEYFRPGTKPNLRGTVRMETPVLYFYSSREVTLSVHVGLAKGFITEWYPHASTPSLDVSKTVAIREDGPATITWDSVTLEPQYTAGFPRETKNKGDRYYAARETLGVPLRVKAAGVVQHEKFLFYRGVANFPIPVSARFTSQGKLRVYNQLKEEIPAVVLFERRGKQVGYRMGGPLENEEVLDPPELTSTVESLYGDLEAALVARGLYPEEAHAMLETWRDSWFEEGSRLFYMVPARFVDDVVPLSITPAPSQIVRVFVGRLELVSPATQRAVTAALAANDWATLAKYGRFLEPILTIIRGQRVATPTESEKSATSPCVVEAKPSASLDKRAAQKPATGP